MSEKTKTQKMTEGNPLGLMFNFAVPLFSANLLQLFYTITDSAVVGRLLGIESFAAVGATASLNWMVLSAVIGMTIGFGVRFAQYFGAGDADELRRVFASSAMLSAVIGVLIAAAGIFGGRAALEAMKTPPDLLDGASLYLRFMLGGMPVTFLNLTLGSMLRAMGDGKTPLRAMVISVLLNIALDFVLVFPFGIAGVAAATLISQLVSSLVCALSLRKTKDARFTFRDINRASSLALLKAGLPLGFRNAVIEAGGLAIQVMVNGYGTAYVAGIAAAKRLYSLLLIAAGSLEAAVGVFVAQNYGAKLMERVRSGVSAGLKMNLVSAFAIAALTLLFGRQIAALLVSGEAVLTNEVLDVAQTQLNVMALGLPVLHLLFLYRSALQGIGDSLVPMLTGFLELAGRFLSLVLFTGIWGAYLADATGWVLAAGLVCVAYWRFAQRMKRDS